MSYFNHAFTKRFLGTQVSGQGAGQNPNTNLDDGFIITSGIPTSALANTTGTANSIYGPGSYGFFDASTYLSVTASDITGCCPLILASASLMANDKIGPYHGGYKESNKSKVINPRYVTKAYVVEACAPQQSVVSIGNTPYTAIQISAISTVITDAGTLYTNGSYTGVTFTTSGSGTGLEADVVVSGGLVTSITITNFGQGYVTGDTITPTITQTGLGDPAIITLTVTPNTSCCYEFLCDETYYLRIDVKGSPALRFLNHNAYQNLSAYTGCCSGPTPTAVDSTLVMLEWAKALVINQYLTKLIMPIVYDESGTAWFAPGTTVDPISGNAVTSAQWWDAYVSPGHVNGACAGMRLVGAYVETKFGNCSFQLTDFFEKEPVQIYASLVDYNGDPCVFEGICFYKECRGLQGMGFGEQVVRDLILSESYLQNFFHTDIRIREITQGDQILNSVNRNALYTRYYLQHSVPRLNNPTGVFDNDQYLLEIISTSRNATLETFLTTWLNACAGCVSLEEHSCTPCVLVEDFPVVP